jgi:glycosyltransferase involved in cell wall biosynthesis
MAAVAARRGKTCARMNILLVTEYFPRSGDCEVRGGVEARAFYLGRELARRHSVHVLCAREPGEPAEETVAAMTIHRCGPPRPYTQAGSLRARGAFVGAASRVGRKLGGDLVDGYNFIGYLAAHRISRSLGIPRVATYHDVWVGEWVRNLGLASGLVGELVERYLLAKTWDAFIANSQATRNKLLAARARSPRIEVVYNGISLADFADLHAPRFEQPTICYVGRLVRYKRVDDLLRAFAQVRQTVAGARLKIVGSGPESDSLRALARQLGLGESVEFLGFVAKHRDVIEVMARSHALCLPSAVEGFGMAIIEAMACGTPVVASSLAPIVEITRNGQGGLLFPCGDVAALAGKLTQMLTDDGLRDRCAGQARSLAAEFDWTPLATKVETIYQQVLRR